MTGKALEPSIRRELQASEPRCLRVLHPYLWIQFAIASSVLVACFFLAVPVAVLPDTTWPQPVWLLLGVTTWTLFHMVASPIADFGLAHRRPHGWAIAFALLFCRTAVFSSLAAMLLATGFLTDWGPAVTLLVPLSVMLALTVAHFRSREWYGVERRDGWRTVRARAGWTLAWGFLLEAPLLLLPYLVRTVY